MKYQRINPASSAITRGSDLVPVISSIGGPRFGYELENFLHRTCDSDRGLAISLTKGDLSLIAIGTGDGSTATSHHYDRYIERRHWRIDPAITELELSRLDPGPKMIRLSLRELGGLGRIIYSGTGYIDRLCACEEIQGVTFTISTLRRSQSGPFTEGMIERFESAAHILLTAAANHVRSLSQANDLVGALTSLKMIEACIANAAEHLSDRETATCARILFGMSTIGIALDLGIGVETVMTYRKRAYHRLGIATQRELLLWYIKLWTHVGRLDFERHSSEIEKILPASNQNEMAWQL